VIVAVTAARVVQVAQHQVVDVVAVRHRVVAARRAVDVLGGVAGARVGRRAFVGIRRRHFDGSLVDVAVVIAVQVTVVQVVGVAFMRDRRVSTARAVDMGMRRVGGMIDHSAFSLVFDCVREGELDELGDVVVGEGVVDVFPVARTADETCLREDAKLL
jgi:hypothetical protein